MKRGTPDHPKVHELAELLHVDWAYAVGILEVLWHTTARYAPRGDIGKWPNYTIAGHIRWPRRKADQLIDALITCGWIDRDPDHRLLIHDWDEHADQSVRKTLKANALDFIKPTREQFIYVVRAVESGRIKIGVTGRRIQDRVSEIQRHIAERLEVVGFFAGGFDLEAELHQKLRKFAQNASSEWYFPSEGLNLELSVMLNGRLSDSDTCDVSFRKDDGTIPEKYGKSTTHRARVAFPEPEPVPEPIEETPYNPPVRGDEKTTRPQTTNAPRRRRTEYSDDWIEWYALYPRHEAAGAGFKAWQKLTKDERVAALVGLRRLSPALHARIASQGIELGCPHPATWINQRRWEDESPVAGNGVMATPRVGQMTFSERHEQIRREKFVSRMAQEVIGESH